MSAIDSYDELNYEDRIDITCKYDGTISCCIDNRDEKKESYECSMVLRDGKGTKQ